MPKFEKSTVKGKKYSVITPSGKKIHFGSASYEHYKDTTGIGAWSHKDHNDKERRKRYRDRHSKIKTKEGNLAYKDKEQPAYYSWNYLW
jgi:hypothetical protein